MVHLLEACTPAVDDLPHVMMHARCRPEPSLHQLRSLMYCVGSVNPTLPAADRCQVRIGMCKDLNLRQEL